MLSEKMAWLAAQWGKCRISAVSREIMYIAKSMIKQASSAPNTSRSVSYNPDSSAILLTAA
jgi:hypothetical protein